MVFGPRTRKNSRSPAEHLLPLFSWFNVVDGCVGPRYRASQGWGSGDVGNLQMLVTVSLLARQMVPVDALHIAQSSSCLARSTWQGAQGSFAELVKVSYRFFERLLQAFCGDVIDDALPSKTATLGG